MHLNIIKYYPFTTFPIPVKYSIDVYSGCKMACFFCPADPNEYLSNEEEFFLATLESDLKEIPKNTLIGLGGGLYEPFSDLNETLEVTLKALKILEKYEMRPLIFTRSTHIKNHLNFLSKLKQKPIIVFSLFFFNKDIDKKNYAYKGQNVKEIEKLFYCIMQMGLNLYPMISPLIKDISDDLKSLLPLIDSFKRLGLKHCLFTFFSQKSATLFSEWNEEERKEYFLSIFDFFIKNEIKPYMDLPDFQKNLSLKDLASFYFLNLWYLESFLKKEEGKEAYRNLSYSLDLLDEKSFEEKRNEDKLLTIKHVGEYTEKILLEDVLGFQFKTLKKMEKKLFSLSL